MLLGAPATKHTREVQYINTFCDNFSKKAQDINALRRKNHEIDDCLIAMIADVFETLLAVRACKHLINTSMFEDVCHFPSQTELSQGTDCDVELFLVLPRS